MESRQGTVVVLSVLQEAGIPSLGKGVCTIPGTGLVAWCQCSTELAGQDHFLWLTACQEARSDINTTSVLWIDGWINSRRAWRMHGSRALPSERLG